ncbi:hypothetical protein HLRTI_003148 [Halorhabdus tiamatea SARL4B]|uniref:YbjN domain-containing protein n=1 Tax=Halorhabdus tiamatea SARL4B TaxID=1033806 RepID=F7PQI3_9EURY|nr:DUF5813 family protein [Halorhabdus tiamatea]ERJ04870.1 hypothetical protein HLRTI_003148 [Halorhabdus tiamatea SARL4B]CCQ33311.1 conserved hypothetical protein [Halorhabdus tiamatea SARL4B]
MTDTLPPAVADAFDDHDPFEASEEGYRVTTTVFDATVTATDTDGVGHEYTVTVRTPMLDAAVEGEVVGPAVEDGWFETFERRLEDAAGATRARVDLDEHRLRVDDSQAVATLVFSYGDPGRAAEIAKTFVEYVEGTYVEGVVPGYDYQPPVSDLLQASKTAGDNERSGTPL